MDYKRIPLSATDSEVFLEAFVPDAIEGYTRKAVLVIPGGGYGDICAYREGEPIALAFLPLGYTAFVLHYTVGRKAPFPAQLVEAAAAIAHIKDHAAAYGIDPEQVFVCGFSAGGHLAASAGTLWKHPAITERLNIPYGYNKPRGMMLIYPVITPDWHCFSFNALLCDDAPSPEALDAVSIEKQVDADTVPAFIMHTANDQVVNVHNALVMAAALSKAERPFELHIYPDAPHGSALANAITACDQPKWDNPSIARWVEDAAVWADNLVKE